MASTYRSSIQRKITFVILTASFVSIALTCACFVAYEFLTFTQRMAETLSANAQLVGANTTAALSFDNKRDAQDNLRALAALPSVRIAAVYDKSGNLFATYARTSREAPIPRTAAQDGIKFFSDRMILFQPIMLDGSRIGTMFIESGYGPIYSRFTTYGFIVILVMLGSLAVAYLFARRIQRKISGPILDLADTARSVSESRNYSIRAKVDSDDEIGNLAAAFNEMLEQIHSLHEDLEQRVIQRTAELEMANKELEAFSYSVSHDLRAPLRHLGGFAELLREKCNDQQDPNIVRYTGIISDSAKKMAKLIDELLEFSRMGRSEMKTQVVELDDLVAEVVGEAKSGIGERKISWNIRPLAKTMGDYAMLKLVFQNLISNAIKYTGKADDAAIEIGLVPEPNRIVCYVKDNGAGFDMRFIDKLFGVFQRLHRLDEFEGIGIGLANVRRIVERHGGKVWAEGEVGKGATFYVSLPLTN
ncbi:MAG TPA: ATP-binding protein [Bacteroidota bacterium]|nr:ATP-binding protein [Bacteroidota bacterium]